MAEKEYYIRVVDPLGLAEIYLSSPEEILEKSEYQTTTGKSGININLDGIFPGWKGHLVLYLNRKPGSSSGKRKGVLRPTIEDV